MRPKLWIGLAAVALAGISCAGNYPPGVLDVAMVSREEGRMCERIGPLRVTDRFHYGRTHPTVFGVRMKARIEVATQGGNAFSISREAIIAKVGAYEAIIVGEILRCNGEVG